MKLTECSIVFAQKVDPDRDNQLHFIDVPSLDFLVRKSIIRMDAEWEPEQNELTSSRPIFAKSISFKNKISIANDVGKLVIKQDFCNEEKYDQLQKLAKKILGKLEKIPYAGIGVNFLSAMPCDNAEQQIVDKFLKYIPSISDENIVRGAFSYVHQLDGAAVTVEVSPVKKVDGASALCMSSNYHLDTEYPKKMLEWIDKIPELQKDFSSRLQKLFGEA